APRRRPGACEGHRHAAGGLDVSAPSESTAMRDRHCGTLRASDVGQRLSVCGWVAKRREHGEHLAFVDLRDHTGLIQCVIDGTVDVHSEYVLRVTGSVTPRPEGTTNANLATGQVELSDCVV